MVNGLLLLTEACKSLEKRISEHYNQAINMHIPNRTYAEVIAYSRFKLLKVYYLWEIMLVAHGMPKGIVILANYLHRTKDVVAFAHLLEAAADLSYDPWVQEIAPMAISEPHLNRRKLLAEADAAFVRKEYRLACQLYGWVLLTSRERDDALMWSIHHLENINNIHYQPPFEHKLPT